MTMFTRCTHCDAAFRVTLEQLQLSSGQVRCGVCQRIFDAFVALSATDPRENESVEPKKEPTPFGVTTAAPIAVPEPPPTFSLPSLAGLGAGAARKDVRSPSTPEPKPSAPKSSPVPRTVEPKPLGSESKPLPSSLEVIEVPGISVGFGDAPEPEREIVFPPRRADQSAASASATSNPLDAIVKRRGAAAPSQPRWPVWASVLAVLLVLQALFWFRGNIANAAPEARPVLQGICSIFGCDVPLPRFADRLTIEFSDLRALDPTRPNRVVLVATIRNRAPDTQAFPMLELTLTDSREQVAVRKVLGPEEYLDAAVDVSQGLASNGEANVRLRMDTGEIEAAGYRIYLFHP